MRPSARVLALALSIAAQRAWAQQEPVDPNAAMPSGHPDVGESPHAGGHVVMTLPESGAEESVEVPAGTVVVRVVDQMGGRVPGAVVRVGSMRDGERGEAMSVTTGDDGTATVRGLSTDGSTAYRVSTDLDGARYGAMPFQLGSAAGYKVSLVRFPVDHTGRGTMIWDARMEVHIRDDRLMIAERMRLVNITGMSLGTEHPNPMAFVPTDGLRFGLPAGYLAFNTAPSMNDLRIEDHGGAAVLRGSIPPTGREPEEVSFQYQVKIQGSTVDLNATIPLPVVTALVITEAPPGLTLSVEGFPPAEARESSAQHVLLAGIERRPTDPPFTAFRVHLGGIPAAAGPARWVAVAVSSVLVFLGLYTAFSRRGARARRSRADLAAERERIVVEAAALARARAAGDVGPITYQRRRRELAVWLGSVLKAEESLG